MLANVEFLGLHLEDSGVFPALFGGALHLQFAALLLANSRTIVR